MIVSIWVGMDFFILLWLLCSFVLRVFLFAGLGLTSFGWHGILWSRFAGGEWDGNG